MSDHSTTFREVTDGGLERVLLVSVAFAARGYRNFDSREMVRLVESAGGSVAGTVTQKRNRPDPACFMGSGKAEETALEASALGVTTIVVDHDLSPGQVTRLERITQCKVIDRTELILAIFAVQARTPQAKIRIELAQLRYMLPRLSGLWHHLDRLGAGIGTRGPGETQLEVDRRRARTRIASLERKVHATDTAARIRRQRRKGMFTVSLAGYTNAGKSTLLNRLCGASVRSEDRLFATLDTTSRRLELPCGETVLVSDTVGFIDNLPESLLSSFRSTLDVVLESDLVLLVADASDPSREARVATVSSTLERIGAEKVPRFVVWNKKDKPGSHVSSGLSISALTGESVDELVLAIEESFLQALDWVEISMDICTGEIEHWFRKKCVLDRFSRNDGGGAEMVCGTRHGTGEMEKFLKSRGIAYCMRVPERNG